VADASVFGRLIIDVALQQRSVGMAIAVLAGLSGVWTARAQIPFTNTIAASRATITNVMAEYGIPGCTVVLVESQRVVWAEGFGLADLETQAPVTTNTVMMIGSVSKFFTAIMAAQLADEGALDLNLSVTNYLPDFSMRDRFAGPPEAWTTRNLLDHHAGLPGDIYNGSFGASDYWPGYIAWMIHYFQRDYPLYPPNVVASYCNSGFNLVGEIVTRHDGVDYAVAAENRIFAPLDMPYSSFLPDKPLVAENLATGHSAGQPTPPMIGNMAATGGAFSRPLDMARIITMILADGVAGGSNYLSQAILDEMGTPANAPLDLDIFLQPGLGLDSVADHALAYAGNVWSKSGDTGTFSAMLQVLRERQLGVFVNINMSHSAGFTISRAILREALLERDNLPDPGWPPMPDPAATNWPYAALQDIEGYYITAAGVDRFIAEADGTLTCIHDAQNNTEATTSWYPHVHGRFYPPGLHHEQFVFTNRAGCDLILRYGSSGSARDEIVYGGYAEGLYGVRYTPPAISAAWSNRVGTKWLACNLWHDDWMYEAGALPAFLLTAGHGILSLAGPQGAVLEPVDDGLAFVGGLLTRGDSAVRIETNALGREFLWFGGYRCERYDDLPELQKGVAVSGAASAHTNALFRYEHGAEGQSILLALTENASKAVLTVFNADIEPIGRGEGCLALDLSSDAPLIVSITSADPVEFDIKTVDITEVRAAMRRTLDQYPFVPGFGVAAQEPGFPPILLTEGHARISPPSPEPSLPLQGHEQFHIASISKTYTAAAIFLLQQRGLLNIADCVTNYAPELNIPRADEITLEMLLQHRSGLPDANNTGWFDGKLENNPLLEFTVEDIVDVAHGLYPNLLFEPGTAYHYTDTGYNILARVIENVTARITKASWPTMSCGRSD